MALQFIMKLEAAAYSGVQFHTRILRYSERLSVCREGMIRNGMVE